MGTTSKLSLQNVVDPTVVILGAGCSQPYGFPLGPQLRDSICKLDPVAEADTFREAGTTLAALQDLIKTLRFSGYTSIDWFLEKRPDLSEVGRMAIARCLIPYEDPGRLFPPSAPKEHWYELFFNQLDDVLPFGETVSRGVSVITFNYDRSLQYYLFRVLATRRRSDTAAVEELSKLNIVHLHGALGGLKPLAASGRYYTPRIDGDSIRSAANEIIVVGEADDSSEPFAIARKLISDARRIVFLGFGFNRTSLRRLGIVRDRLPANEDRLITGTTWHLPDPDWSFVKERVFTESKRHSVSVHKYLQSRLSLGPQRRLVIR